MEQYNIFPTYLWVLNIFEESDLTEKDNQTLLDYLLKLRKKDLNTDRFLEFNGGYQSNDLDYSKNPVLFELSKFLQICMTEVIEKSVGMVGIELDNMWCNINYQNSFNITHNHPSSQFSGVYYVKAKPVIEQGVIRFSRDDLSQSYLRREKINLKTGPNPFTFLSMPVLPEIGKLLIFPSWVNHHVTPNNLSDSDRVSLSFNFF